MMKMAAIAKIISGRYPASWLIVEEIAADGVACTGIGVISGPDTPRVEAVNHWSPMLDSPCDNGPSDDKIPPNPPPEPGSRDDAAGVPGAGAIEPTPTLILPPDGS